MPDGPPDATHTYIPVPLTDIFKYLHVFFLDFTAAEDKSTSKSDDGESDATDQYEPPQDKSPPPGQARPAGERSDRGGGSRPTTRQHA